MKVSVIGTGYVGLVTGACLAEAGHDVLCMDVDAGRIERLRQGHIPIFEPGLEPIVRRNVAEGRLHFTTSTAEAVAHGTLQFIASGNATGFDTAPELKLIDLVHSLKSGHRQGAAFVMNSKTMAAVRKFKAADGTFLWQPGVLEGQPSRLLGYPVVEAEDMPDVGANACPIAFGNFKAGYLITERRATTILRDPFTNKPYVNFYATKRIGGQVLDSDAIKLLKISA